MDVFRQRRSKVYGVASDRRSNVSVASSPLPASFRGNRYVQNQRQFPKLASDSSSCDSDTTEEDSLMIDVGWRSSRQSTTIPMKKLLAEEMSKEKEPRRRSPSVIARLMGLDGLPTQQPGHKEHKSSHGNGQDKAQKSCTFYNRRSSKKNSKDEQEFKDVFEVLDSKKAESTSYSSQGTGYSKRTDAEMDFIRQKFMDVKRISTDEKLQCSKEFDNALEVLDSNKDLLLKFLQQPDSLFTKHLRDLKNSPSESHSGRISPLKSSDTLISESSSLGRRTDRKSRWKNHSKSPQNREAYTSSHSCAVWNPPESSKVRVEEENELASQPTKIVVLKPNFEKSQNTARISSSPSSSHHLPSDCRKHREIMGSRNREDEVWGKRMVPGDSESLRPDSRISREIAKEITKKMRNTSRHRSVTILTSKFRGYAGDESSGDLSGSESADSDVTTVTSRDNFGMNNRRRSSSFDSFESPVSREARKRISERWKMSHRSQEACVVRRGSTLGEMLAIPQREVRPANFSGRVEKECSPRYGFDYGTSLCGEPLGISSKDGWKDGLKNGRPSNFTRSRSLLASADFRSPRTNLTRHIPSSSRIVMPKVSRRRGRNKALKGNFSSSEDSLSRDSMASMKRSQFLSMDNNEKNDSPLYVDLSDFLVMSGLEEDGQSVGNPVVSEASASTITTAGSVDNEKDLNNHNAVVSSEPCHMELSATSSLNGDYSAGDLDTLASEEMQVAQQEEAPLYCPEPQLESRTNTKEADQPSPVSVFEAPFTDDISSSSECFESLSADLHGLRMQLRLLKMESESYAEGSMLVSSDDDADLASTGFTDDKRTLKADSKLESSYISDVLLDSGVNITDPDTFISTWYSPDCPVNPSVFEELEKKYYMTSWSRAERKLMFDRINSKLLEIYHRSANQHPWARPAGRTQPKWNERGLEDYLCKLLACHDKKGRKDMADKVFGSESQWLDLGDDIDLIGREIEGLLMEELIAEVVAMG